MELSSSRSPPRLSRATVHALYFSTLGVVASSVERLATEIRHLQRTEVLEPRSTSRKARRASSAMPHKRNPVLTENGRPRSPGARLRPAAMENVALWHERDISHSPSSGPRPGRDGDLDFALARLTGIIDGSWCILRTCEKPRPLGGLVHSQRVLLVDPEGRVAEDAYRLGSGTRCLSGAARKIFFALLIGIQSFGAAFGAELRSFSTWLPPEARRHDLRRVFGLA